MLSKIIQFKLWQLFLYELAIISLGIVIGAYWSEFFWKIIPLLLTVFIVAGFYIIKIALKQLK